jgi:thiol-disulfide isomerase/thioredoxin
MWGLSILAAASALSVSPTVAGVPRLGGYPSTIVMFGAHWCAPCMGELRRLPELAAAAAPDQLLLAWVDSSVGPSQTTTGFESLSPNAARRLARSLMGDGYGLPFSVMFDPRGDVCAVQGSPLDSAEIANMRLRCTATK